MALANTKDLAGLTEAVKQIQAFFSSRRENLISRSAVTSLYRGIQWCLENVKIDQGHLSYVAGNFRAASPRPSAGDSLQAKVTAAIETPHDGKTARGGEIEYALRSLWAFLQHAELGRSLPEQTFVWVINAYLAALVVEFKAQSSDWDFRW